MVDSVKLNFKDSCVRISGKVSIVKNIVIVDGDILLVYQSFKQYEDFFDSPMKSSSLGIEKVSDLDDAIRVAKLCDIEAKCVLLPVNNKYIAIPFTDATWSNKAYAVVDFTEEEEVEVVPLKWLSQNDKKCAWPSYKSSTRLSTAVKCAFTPTKEFKTYSVRVLYKTNDYETARRKLKLAEEVSDLQTDAESQESGRKQAKKRNPRYESNSSDNEEQENSVRTSLRKSPRKGQNYPAPPVLPPPPEGNTFISAKASTSRSSFLSTRPSSSNENSGIQ